jgi:hypothetical protein
VHRDPITLGEVPGDCGFVADPFYAAQRLVSRSDRKPQIGHYPPEGFDIATAQTAGFNREDRTVWAGVWNRHLAYFVTRYLWLD